LVNPIIKSAVCPVIIGRSVYIDTLRAALAQARQGSGQTMLLTGEAGIGESRLIAELKAFAAQQNILTLQGDCFERDRTFPFAPIIELLRQFISTTESNKVKQVLTDPTLLSILPELNWLSTTKLFTAPEPENEKRKLFYTLWQTIARIASQ
jgi:predicted ATPase